MMNPLTEICSDTEACIATTGDQVAHKIGLDYGNSTIMERVLNNMRAASNKISQAFSGIPIFPSFGNNDLPGDYIIPKDSKFYEGVLAFWQPLILCKKCSFKVTTEEELKMTFLAGGYYKASIPRKNGSCFLFFSFLKLTNFNFQAMPFNHQKMPIHQQGMPILI